MNREKQKDKIIEALEEENSSLRNMVGHLQDRINTYLENIKILKKNNRNVAISIIEINRTLKVIKQAAVKATAQDILQQMWDWKDRGTPFIADIQELSDRYGVEVKNDDLRSKRVYPRL